MHNIQILNRILEIQGLNLPYLINNSNINAAIDTNDIQILNRILSIPNLNLDLNEIISRIDNSTGEQLLSENNILQSFVKNPQSELFTWFRTYLRHLREINNPLFDRLIDKLNEYDRLKNKLDNKLDKIGNHDITNNINQYLNKYLKYKSKYLKLKK